MKAEPGRSLLSIATDVVDALDKLAHDDKSCD